MDTQTTSKNITIGIEHIYCCKESQYSKYIITDPDLYDEVFEFISSYNDSYFLDDCPGRLGADLILTKFSPINKDEYDLIKIKHSHVHC